MNAATTALSPCDPEHAQLQPQPEPIRAEAHRVLAWKVAPAFLRGLRE